MANRQQSTFVPFILGQKVWLNAQNLKTLYHKKMAPKHKGLFEIMEVLGPVTYHLGLPKAWKIRNVFHTTLLHPYQETETYGKNFPQPPPILQGGEEVYEIKMILRHRKWGSAYQYLIKWSRYPISNASWESEESFSNNGDTLAKYKQQHGLHQNIYMWHLSLLTPLS